MFKQKERMITVISWLIVTSPLMLGVLLVLFGALTFGQLIFIVMAIGLIAAFLQLCFKVPLLAILIGVLLN